MRIILIMLMRMMLTAGIQLLPKMRMIFSYKSNDGRVQKATNTRYSQTSQVIAMVMVVVVTMMTMVMVVMVTMRMMVMLVMMVMMVMVVMVVMVTMMTMTLVVWESSKCIAHMNHSPLSATLSFYDYSGHSASGRIDYFERKMLVTHTSLG